MTDAEWKKLILDSVNRIEKRLDIFDNRLSGLEKGFARFEANSNNVINDLQGHHQTLYGPDGRGGLTADLQTLRHRQSWWNRGLTIFSAFVAAMVAWLKLGGE